MLVAESSCGFPVFGNRKSSRSCGCTDSSRASCSCSNTRSSHSKDIYSFQDAGRIYSPGVTGASRPRGHSVECTCSRSCRCTADVKLSTAVQLSVVTAGLEGAVVQDIEWPVWLMKATWIRLLKRAKGGHVKSSDACVSSFWVCLHRESWSDSCACACVCGAVAISSLHPHRGVGVARFLSCTMMTRSWALASVIAVRVWADFYINTFCWKCPIVSHDPHHRTNFSG